MIGEGPKEEGGLGGRPGSVFDLSGAYKDTNTIHGAMHLFYVFLCICFYFIFFILYLY